MLDKKVSFIDDMHQAPGSIFAAIKKHDVDAVYKLVKHYRGQVLKKHNWVKNHEGENPFHALVNICYQYKDEQHKIFNILLSVLPEIPEAINAKSGKSHDGDTPLEVAILKNKTYLFPLFLCNGADLQKGLNYARKLKTEKLPSSASVNTHDYDKCIKILEAYEKHSRVVLATKRTFKNPIFICELISCAITFFTAILLAAIHNKKANKQTMIILWSVIAVLLILNLVTFFVLFLKIIKSIPLNSENENDSQNATEQQLGCEACTSVNGNMSQDSKKRDNKKINKFTHEYCNPNFHTNKEFIQQLTNAINSGDKELAVKLINSKKKDQSDILNTLNSDGYTPLMIAAKKSNLELIELLLTNNADAKIANKYGITFLHLAIKYIHDKKDSEQLIINIISNLPKISLDRASNSGMNPLMIASKRGLFNVCTKLIEMNVYLYACDRKKNNFLHHIALSAKDTSCDFLTDTQITKLDKQNHCNKTPLIIAAESGKVALFKRIFYVLRCSNTCDKNSEVFKSRLLEIVTIEKKNPSHTKHKNYDEIMQIIKDSMLNLEQNSLNSSVQENMDNQADDSTRESTYIDQIKKCAVTNLSSVFSSLNFK